VTDEAPEGFVNVRFELDRDEHGWPPAESEGLWAEPLGNDEYRIDNAPWFVMGLAVDDVVDARTGADGRLWAVERRRWSGRQTIRLLARSDRSDPVDLPAIVRQFEELGVFGEIAGQWGLVALDVGLDADLARVKALVHGGEADARWYVEEGCISDDWRRL
jgi:hypothetical protein